MIQIVGGFLGVLGMDTQEVTRCQLWTLLLPQILLEYHVPRVPISAISRIFISSATILISSLHRSNNNRISSKRSNIIRAIINISSTCSTSRRWTWMWGKINASSKLITRFSCLPFNLIQFSLVISIQAHTRDEMHYIISSIFSIHCIDKCRICRTKEIDKPP